ncbi:phage terminase small subunit [Eubacterium callanderi]|uniref:phage terminase small subunit n=1 Tax=Eubacterium callanderi TaxID=53442 RepID=UPI001D133C95|nr:phage terminase small subunit [Eubacterium callanderi]MCC3401102.1 terminase [Eubacterium callanderi]
MPRAPNEKAETAKQMYLEGQKMVDIAAALDIPEGTIRSWKNRYKWSATLQKDNRNVAKKCGAPVGNKNAVGGPPGNKKAEKFGFFSKYLPPETKEIFDAVQDADPIDLLWHQIQIQYAAIVRAQRIMYVEDQEGSTKVTSMESAGSEAYMVQMAWDKQASFLQAQSRAMKTLQGLFKQYDELLKSDLATEEQKARIDRLRAEIAKVEAENKERAGGEQPGDDGFLEALNGSAAKDWADED